MSNQNKSNLSLCQFALYKENYIPSNIEQQQAQYGGLYCSAAPVRVDSDTQGDDFQMQTTSPFSQNLSSNVAAECSKPPSPSSIHLKFVTSYNNIIQILFLPLVLIIAFTTE